MPYKTRIDNIWTDEGKKYLHEKHFYRADVKEMKYKLTLFQKRVSKGECGVEELIAFKGKQKQILVEIGRVSTSPMKIFNEP